MILQVVLSVAVLAAIMLAAAGIFILLRRPASERAKGLLMLAVAGVTLVNIWLLTAPVG